MTEQTIEKQLSYVDTINSLTGYEEDAIEEHFGAPPAVLMMQPSLSKIKRALIFTDRVRQGDKVGPALRYAKSLTLLEVVDAFLDDDEDAEDFNPDEPDTEQGKDDSSSA